MSSEERKGPGRPKIYAGDEPGAPKITIRFSLDVYEWIKGRAEGARAYLERVVRADREATATGEDSARDDRTAEGATEA